MPVVERMPEDDDSAEERDELESDTNIADKDIEERVIRRKSKSNRVRSIISPGLVFTNDKRCTACIDRGLEECTVLKTPYLKLEKYVDWVLTGTADMRRPKNSACLACHEKHAKFCRLPITREKLGPGFTVAHLAGPFPVPASPEKPKEQSSRVLRPHKKARTLSREFPFPPNPGS